MADDWMFGCQKGEDLSDQPTASDRLSADGLASDSKHVSAASGQSPVTDEQSPGTAGQSPDATGQAKQSSGQTDKPNSETDEIQGQVKKCEEAGTGSRQSWTMSVPVLRSSISFANALPFMPPQPAPHQQQSPHQKIEPAVASQGHSRVRQQLDASVADWLSHQVSGELLTDGLGSGNSLAELATAGQHHIAAHAGRSSDADATAADGTAAASQVCCNQIVCGSTECCICFSSWHHPCTTVQVSCHI